MHRLLLLLAVLAGHNPAAAHDDARAHYLANEGLMAAHGNTKVLFDPLFTESFGQYRLLPDAMRAALFAGEPPWDGIDAVFISHYHDDHFAPGDMLNFLRARPTIQLYAPRQAVAAMEALSDDDTLFARVTAVDLDHGDPPLSIEAPGLLIEVVRIPHSGWPTRRRDVENLAWRVTLDDGPTVLHLGDADTRDEHFARDAGYWQQRIPAMAFPPYWFFLSNSGQQVLRERLQPRHAVGVHVPVDIPADPAARDEALRQFDLFTRPGEVRPIEHSH
jgi:L-ascorbate metabolism protein UlaG (beta-lactamase superfamily)